jgi:hypothetical protein
VTELIASDEFPTAVPLIGAAEAAEMAARPTTEPANTANNVFLITVLLFLQFAQASSLFLTLAADRKDLPHIPAAVETTSSRHGSHPPDQSKLKTGANGMSATGEPAQIPNELGRSSPPEFNASIKRMLRPGRRRLNNTI